MSGWELKAMDVNDKEEEFGAFNMTEESVSHSHILMGALYQAGKVSHTDLGRHA